MKNILLLDADFIKRYGLVNDNLDVAYINPAIFQAQDISLQQLIGTNLYNKLCDDVENNTVVGKYKTLLDDYITPYLLQSVQSIICITHFAQFRNAGIVRPYDENVNNTSLDECKFLKDYFDKKAKFYADLIARYLCENSNDFPEYTSWSGVSDLKPSGKQTYSCNIVL